LWVGLSILFLPSIPVTVYHFWVDFCGIHHCLLWFPW
jgi:hypothetical protein